jgi:hypothetical protein
MKLPLRAIPARRTPIARAAASRESRRAVRPQGCCAESCVNVPGVGKVCKCKFSAPICP